MFGKRTQSMAPAGGAPRPAPAAAAPAEACAPKPGIQTEAFAFGFDEAGVAPGVQTTEAPAARAPSAQADRLDALASRPDPRPQAKAPPAADPARAKGPGPRATPPSSR